MIATQPPATFVVSDPPALPVPWPVVHADTLLTGNLDSPAAVCTMWTETKRVARLLNPDSYCVIGNLYRHSGVNALIRNILAKPSLRYLYLWGNDLMQTGDTLAAFFQQGVGEDRHIIGTQTQVEPELPLDAVAMVRNCVQFVDLRGLPADRVQAEVEQARWLPPFAAASYYPQAEVVVEQWPAEPSGFRVAAQTVAQAWIKVVNQVMRYGQLKVSRTAASGDLKELYNMTAVISSEDVGEPYIPDYIAAIPDAPTTAANIADYYRSILGGAEVEGVSYTYGQRLRHYRGQHDQIAKMINVVRSQPDSKRMFATTWDVELDGPDGEPPCLTSVLGSMREGSFYLTAHFRSHDIYKAWVKNAFALRALQQQIAEEAGVMVGPMTVISHSAHIYRGDWLNAQATLESSLQSSQKRGRKGQYDLDPRGYFIIKIEGRDIVATLHDYADRPLRTFRADKARKLIVELTDGGYLSQTGHAMYIGSELQKAEIASELGLAYRQDRALPLTERAEDFAE